MRFGFNFFARDLGAVGSIAILAEEHRFSLTGPVDSPSLAFDPYVALALMATQTSRIRLGPLVTVPDTRHPLIIANIAAALEQLAPGRSFLGLGTGNTGVRHAGLKPTTLKTLAGTIDVARRLLAGETVEADGAKMTVKGGGHPVPILIAASGPKSLRLAGQIADCVLMNIGIAPELVAEGLGWVREGAEAAGRDPATVEVWVMTSAAIGHDGAAAIDSVKPAIASKASYVFNSDAVARTLPPDIRARVAEARRAYQYREHLTPGHTSNYWLVERLGLADYLLERFLIAGTPEDCLRKLEPLQAMGVQNVCLGLATSPDLAASIRMFGETVVQVMEGSREVA